MNPRPLGYEPYDLCLWRLGNGRSTLEAITALANTFVGVVLIGVDEDLQGAGQAEHAQIRCRFISP